LLVAAGGDNDAIVTAVWSAKECFDIISLREGDRANNRDGPMNGKGHVIFRHLP
jgi:hypothetical protein